MLDQIADFTFFAVELPDELHLGGSGRASTSDLQNEVGNAVGRGVADGATPLRPQIDYVGILEF